MNTSPCALCGNIGMLRKSHIIPKFAARKLRATRSGRFRNPDAPNRVKQDIQKIRLLCDNCEGILNFSETTFARTVFHPVLDSTLQFVEHDSWLLRFSTGLAWKALYLSLNDLRNGDSTKFELAKQTLERWRAYLLKTRPDPGPAEQHLWFAIEPLRRRRDIPKYIRWHLLNGVGRAVVGGGTNVYVVTYFLGFFFCAAINPPVLEKWHGTAIAERGILSIYQIIEDDDFARFIVERTYGSAERLGTSNDNTFRARVEGMLEDDRGPLNRESTIILVADLLAKRATPIYPDTAQKYLSQAKKGELLGWFITVSDVRYEQRPEGVITVLQGTSHSDPSNSLNFVLRGHYAIERGQQIQIVWQAGLLVPEVTTITSRTPSLQH